VPSSPLLITALAIASAAVGVWLGSNKALARKLVPFGGGALIGVALVWVLPEMADYFRWPVAVAWLTGGVAVLALIDRFVYPVCPACAPTHDHEHCSTRLHGFATPLLAASALHAALDGWGAAAGESSRLSLGVVAAIMAHKVPEGLALGVIARAALRSRRQAFLWCVLAQVATLVGAALESVLAPHLGDYGLNALLALAGGSFLYLGGHAVHGEIRRSGGHPAFWPALTGVAGSGVLRLFMR
jgi:ZIP family zinc transporter/zinc and cadmium transporter